MSKPIALQLYSVREVIAEKGFEDVVRQVADIGYVGVEPAGFPGTTPEAAGALFAELGLEVCSAHTRFPLGDEQAEVLESMAAIGCPRIISGKGPDDFTTVDDIKRVCDLVNEANAVAVEKGFALGYHNHWWEFEPVERQLPYRIMLERIDPAVFFEIDVYWVQAAGLDPAEIVAEFGARAPLLHIKDGPAVRDEPMTAVGSGAVDIPGVVNAGEPHTEWLVVELDRCATDMVEAVAQSYTYLVGEGLARGNKS